MKPNILFRKWFIPILSMLLLLSSCVKKYADNQVEFDGNLKPMAGIYEGGLANIGTSTLVLNPTHAADTLTFNVNYAATETAPRNLNFTFGYDEAALNAYNAQNSTLKFQKFPDSIYSLPSTTAILEKGFSYKPVNLYIFPSKIDPTKNYLLPISIKTAEGASLSANFKTIYYRLIGNAIAGPYKWDYTRWNSATNTGSPVTSTLGRSTLLVGTSSTSNQVKSGYYILPRYEIKFKDSAGVLSNMTVSFNADDLATMTAGGVTVTNGPVVEKADFVNKEFIFQFTVSTAGGSRYLVDRFYK